MTIANPTTTDQIVLASRPHGAPTPENFRLETVELPELDEGEVLVRNTYMSVDPYMRGRMNDTKSYIPPFQIDTALDGGAVGEVIASRADSIDVGAQVRHGLGWREHAVVSVDQLTVIDTDAAPASAYLGILGMPGLTAYVGLTAVAQMRAGDTVYVSGASGAVGQVVGQLAKALGAKRVVGSAGSDEKLQRLRELGYDDAFNYKQTAVRDGLGNVAPEGIDVYFDNVGGDHLEAAIEHLNRFGRVAMCGAVSQYNATEKQPGPRNLALAIGKGLTLRGFLVGQYPQLVDEYREKVATWLADGTLHGDETIREGLGNAPQAFIELLEGANTGKMLVRL